jgi:hypothetical protein
MKTFFTLILHVLNSNILKPEPKICFNCRHFLFDRTAPKYSRCSKFINTEKYIEYLITGEKQFSYEYCLTMRNDENKCGFIGKEYEFDEKKTYELEPDDPILWGEY